VINGSHTTAYQSGLVPEPEQENAPWFWSTRPLAYELVNSWPSAGTTLILRTWRFRSPNRSTGDQRLSYFVTPLSGHLHWNNLAEGRPSATGRCPDDRVRRLGIWE
jgi:hypothetical protein